MKSIDRKGGQALFTQKAVGHRPRKIKPSCIVESLSILSSQGAYVKIVNFTTFGSSYHFLLSKHLEI